MQLHIPAWTACKLLAALALRRNDVTKLSAQLRLCDGLVQPYPSLFRRWWWCGKVYETRWNESLATGQNADPPGSANPEFVDQTPSPDILLPNSLFSLQADQYINLSNPKPLPCLVLSPSVSVCLAPHLSFLQFRLSHTSHPSRSLSLHHCPLFFRACFSHRWMLVDFINPSLALSLSFLTFDVWSECVILTSQLMCLLQHVH